MIAFTSIVNDNIFVSEYASFSKNNTISFPSKGKIAVLYGPNGAGKTSLVKVLQGDKGTSVAFEYEGVSYTDPTSIFHIISDQNNRNIVQGDCGDFLLGDQIHREEQLNKDIDSEFGALAKNIIAKLKEYGIGASNSPLFDLITDSTAQGILKDFANIRSRGMNNKTVNCFQFLRQFGEVVLTEEEQTKLTALQNDIAKKNDSLIRKIKELATQTLPSINGFKHIEAYSEAIRILEQFKSDECIVCDHPIQWANLVQKKTSRRQNLIARIEEKHQKGIEAIISLAPLDDPFSMREILLQAIDTGDAAKLIELCTLFNHIEELYQSSVLSEIAAIVQKEESLISNMEELQELIAGKLELGEEDELYIQSIIKDSMDKNLELIRNPETKNITIRVADHDLLGVERSELPLSAGEQNFLSLSFEFLKAKNQKEPIIVIDDPISSFDSIYKNKVVYSLVKILEEKQCLVLTHTVELLRLLEAQYRNCYSLYLLNNTEDAENGFIKVADSEKKLIISLKDLLKAFRGDVLKEVKDERLFLLSMIPFLRGFSSIIGDQSYESLTSLMHFDDGDNKQQIDLVAFYLRILKPIDFDFSKPCMVSGEDILNVRFLDQDILNGNAFPLLNKTLKHSLTYLYLRLTVEKKLKEKFPETRKCDQLGAMISKAFKGNDREAIRKRVFLTSRKTLLNEFNHFEGNLSIFQPAIDISDQALKKEKQEILKFVSEL
jgi:hypothetical protein